MPVAGNLASGLFYRQSPGKISQTDTVEFRRSRLFPAENLLASVQKCDYRNLDPSLEYESVRAPTHSLSRKRRVDVLGLRNRHIRHFTNVLSMKSPRYRSARFLS